MVKFRSRLYRTDRARDFEHVQDRHVRMRQIYDTIDRQGYQWIVVLVAGIGFFLDGYTLFAGNMAFPMISYVYWENDSAWRNLTWINIATLAGTMLGQLTFGYLADRHGRKKMYGVELILLIVSTFGVVMSSEGVNGSMNVFAWLMWWRIVVGIGVGADYPLSAVITSEFAPTKHRARMMASVFFMQPLGQIAGNLVSLVVLAITRAHGDTDITRSVDIMWRWVIGIGVLPGAIATLFRLAIPETPRFLLDIDDDPVKAEFDATTLFADPALHIGASPDGDFTTSIWSNTPLPTMYITSQSDFEDRPASQAAITHPATLNSHWHLSRADIVQYFWTEGNWRTLAGTSICWLLLDFGFYGIGLSSPQFLAKTWGSLNIQDSSPVWMTDDSPNADLFKMFMNSSIYALVILNIGSFVGGSLLILLAHKLDRTGLQKWGFLAQAAHFIALGTMFIKAHKDGPVAIVLYIIGQTLFNFGPNATTYMLPAEVFPTRYRATCHGISAACGKLGSILVQILSTYYPFGVGPGDEPTIRHGYMLIIFSCCMIIGAAVTHFWIPSVQRGRDGKGKLWGGTPETLEVLAVGRLGGMSRYAVRPRTNRWDSSHTTVEFPGFVSR